MKICSLRRVLCLTRKGLASRLWFLKLEMAPTDRPTLAKCANVKDTSNLCNLSSSDYRQTERNAIRHTWELTIVRYYRQLIKFHQYVQSPRPTMNLCFLWPPCVADADIIFLPCGFFPYFFLSIFSSPNPRGRRLDVLPYFDTWCGLSANLECRSEMCCTQLAGK